MSPRIICLVCFMLLSVLIVPDISTASSYDFYLFPDPMPTLGVPSTYKFVDSKPWTEKEKNVVREAIREWDVWICDQQTFYETTGDDWDISLRWAGSDLFQDWTTTPGYSNPGWNLSGANAMWTPSNLTPPWNTNIYPLSEIYFNSNYTWYVDDNPKTDEVFTGSDLLTIAKHEFGHALGIRGDWGNPNVWPTPPSGTSKDEVMWDVIPDGERRHLKKSDIDALRALGKYHVAPEPATMLLLGSGLIGLVGLRRKFKK